MERTLEDDFALLALGLAAVRQSKLWQRQVVRDDQQGGLVVERPAMMGAHGGRCKWPSREQSRDEEGGCGLRLWLCAGAETEAKRAFCALVLGRRCPACRGWLRFEPASESGKGNGSLGRGRGWVGEELLEAAVACPASRLVGCVCVCSGPFDVF